MRIFLNIVILLLCLNALSIDAFSCTCRNSSTKEKLRDAKVVFVGEAISITCSAGCPENIITFKVEKYWKGVVEPKMQVSTRLPIGAACGVDVKKGDKVLAFAHEGANNNLEIDICSSTHLKYARNTLKELGKAKFLSK